MGLVREPLDVDFFVDPRPFTEKEKEMISDFIKTDKEKRKRKKTSKKKHYYSIDRTLGGLHDPAMNGIELFIYCHQGIGWFGTMHL
jgi:hypothetical protein